MYKVLAFHNTELADVTEYDILDKAIESNNITREVDDYYTAGCILNTLTGEYSERWVRP
jgi:hypothetical protein